MDNQNIVLSVNSFGVISTIDATQNDTGRQVNCLISDYQIPEGSTAKFFAKKPSGMQIYNAATISENKVIFPLTSQTLAEIGTTAGQIEITEPDGKVSSFIFRINVQPTLSGDYPESKDESTFLEQTLEDMQNQINESVSAADKATEDANAATEAANTATASANEAADKANEAAANAGELPNRVDEIEGEVDNLYDMTNGKSVDDNAYSVTVPNGAKFATVKKLGGKSIAWNQLVDYTWFPSKSSSKNIIFTNNNNGTVTITREGDQSGTDYSNKLTTNPSVMAGHKYYSSGFYDDTKNITLDLSMNPSIGTATKDGEIDLRFRVLTSTELPKTIPLLFMDLTQMFGAGNEPSTVEEFNAMFPNQYYPYNAGEIVSADVDEVVEQGKNLMPLNLFRTQTKDGITFTNNNDGTYTVNGTATADVFVSYSVSSFKKGHKYLLKGCPEGGSFMKTYCAYFVTAATLTINDEGNGGIGKCIADGNSTYVILVSQGITVNNLVFVPQLFDLTQMFGAGNEPSTVEEFNAIYPNEFYPYHQNTYPIPESIRSIEGYGWSAGDVYNEVDFENKKFIKRVGRVDLGTLSWRIKTQYEFNRFETTDPIDDLLSVREDYYSFILCAKYTPSNVPVNTYNEDKTISAYNKKIYILDSAYSDATAFKSAMNGVMLYYELAEPIITDISDILDSFEVESGGTISFVQSDSTKHLPVPNTIEYSSTGADKIAQLEEKINDVKSTANTAKTTADSALSGVNALNTQVENINTQLTAIDQDITNLETDVENINTHISAEKDYIVEQGTSGDWTYRKWNSGIAECWLNKRLTVTYIYGNLVQGNTNLPFEFVKIPVATGSFGVEGMAGAYLAYMGTTLTTVDMYGSLDTGHEGENCWFNVYVFGSYKKE